MGAVYSHPPAPLVEVHGPRNKVLVPAGASFTVNPPLYRFPTILRGRRYQRTPVYQRVHSPYSEDSRDYRPRGRPRERGRRRPPSDDTGSEMNFSDVSPRPRRGKMRGGGRIYAPGAGGMGIPMRMGGRPQPGPMPMGAYIDPPDGRIRSAPDLNMEYSAGPSPRAAMHGMSPGMPGYRPAAPGYRADMGGNPYAYPPGGAGAPFQGRAQTPIAMQPQSQPRKPMRPPGLNEVPMGAYAAGMPPPPMRANIEPPAATRLNRKQPSNKKVGPSGQEWIEGDSFLDACTCTTNCTCRKGHRVLYRSQAQDGEGHNGWGEIRYVLKDDLGKDCGDHSKCNNRDDNGKKKTKAKRRQGRDSDESLGSQDEIREHVAAMRKDLAHMKLKDKLGEGARPPFGGMPPGSIYPGMMEDPRMAARLGADPYGMAGPNRPPPDMHGPIAGKPDRMGRMGMHRPMPDEMGYDDEPFSESGYGMGEMFDPMMEMGGQPPRNMGGRDRPPDMIRPPPRRGRRRPRGPPGTDMGMGGFGRGGPMGGGGMAGRRPRPGGRRRRPEFGPDDDYDMDRGMRGGGFGGHGRRDEYGDMDDDDDEAAWEDEHNDDGRPGMRESPSGGANGGWQRMGRPGAGRGGGGRHARVEDDDAEI